MGVVGPAGEAWFGSWSCDCTVLAIERSGIADLCPVHGKVLYSPPARELCTGLDPALTLGVHSASCSGAVCRDGRCVGMPVEVTGLLEV